MSRIRRSPASRVFDGANAVVLSLIALLCLLPLAHVVAVSFSDRFAVEGDRVIVWPVGFNTANYNEIFNNAQFLNSFGISVGRVLLGTTINLLVIVLTAYPLAVAKAFPGKASFRWLLIFTMLFEGGLIPLYLVVSNLGLLDTIWSLVLPTAVNAFYIIVMVNFFRGLPRELYEAAVVDGASHWRILFGIFIPLSRPGLVTLGLFAAVFHWNSWFDGLIYMTSSDNYPLQSYLKASLTGSTSVLRADPAVFAQLSSGSLKAAQIVVATLPIILVYPFLQRHFVAGLTLGSVKE